MATLNSSPPVLPALNLDSKPSHDEYDEHEPKIERVDDVHRFGDDPRLADAYATVTGWDEETRRREERRLVRQLDLRIALPVVIMWAGV